MCAKAIIFFFKKVDELFGSKCIGIYILFFPQQVMSYLHWEVRHSLISIFAGFDLPGFVILPYPFITPFLRYCFGGFSLGPHINSVNQAPFYSAPSIFAVLRNLVQETWLEKSVSRNLVREKWLTRKKNLSLPNHFSRTIFLHFSRKVVAEWMVQRVFSFVFYLQSTNKNNLKVLAPFLLFI